jgi:hypothetical protein
MTGIRIASATTHRQLERTMAEKPRNTGTPPESEKPRNTGTPPEYAAPRPDNFAKINPDRKEQRGPADKQGESVPKDTQRIDPAKPPELAHPEENAAGDSPGGKDKRRL